MGLETSGADDQAAPPAQVPDAAASAGERVHDDHAVHFYEHDEHRLALVQRFIKEGHHRGQRVFVLGREALCAELASPTSGAEIGNAPQSLTVCLASDLLNAFTVRGAPHRATFEHFMDALLGTDPRESTAQPTRVYEEAVDILGELGDADGALLLEKLWNEYAFTRRLEVLCAYHVDRFRTASDSGWFEQICRAHGRVIPHGSYAQAEDERERLYQVAVLQQRSRWLDCEVARRRASEQLVQEAQAVRDDFVVVAGHELRTPLTVIQLQVQHLLRSAEPDISPRVQRALALTARGVDRLTSIVEQVLEVSRIEAGRMLLQLGPVDLAVVVRQAVARQPMQDDVVTPIDVVAQEGVLGRWDITRIERVVMTLLSNAVKFGRAQPVEVSVTRRGQNGRLTVRDRGAGIEPCDQARIFARYARRDAAIGVGGLGLGLWIARAVVMAHGGTIDVESAPGEGATFVVELPLVGGVE